MLSCVNQGYLLPAYLGHLALAPSVPVVKAPTSHVCTYAQSWFLPWSIFVEVSVLHLTAEKGDTL